MSESTFVRLVVGFILSATGLHASCPIELSPPSVVVKYGDRVSVNCTTSATHHDGIGWESPFGGTGGIQNVSYVTWTVEKLTYWSITPQCFINPPMPADQCGKKLSVVLYTFPDNIAISSSAGSAGVMNRGETYTLTCDVLNVAPVQNLTVTWYKGNELFSRQSVNNPSEEPVNQPFVQDFSPTEHDDGIKIRCEAHLDLKPKGPYLSAISQEYPVTVHFGPDIKCSGIEVWEGDTLEGRCPVTGNPSPRIRWLKDGQPIDPAVPLKRGDTGVYTIQADGNNPTSKTLRVSVQYGPEITCAGNFTANEYDTFDVNCIEGFPQPNITWYKDDEEVQPPEILTRGDAGQYTIFASNNLSSVKHTLDIDVLYPPSQIAELEDVEVDVGSSTGLKCSSVGNPRPTYSWSYYQAPNVKLENEDGVSLLHIDSATANNNGSYTCYAWNKIGNISKTVRVTVKGAKPECPVKITPSRMVISYRKQAVATCEPISTISTNVKELYWQTSQGNNRSTTWSSTHEDWDQRPVCAATFEGIGKCEKPLDFTMYKTPDSVSIHSVNHTGPMTAGKVYQLQCNITNVAPVQNLIVRWYQGNKTMETNGTLEVTGCPRQSKASCDSGTSRSPVNVLSTINISLGRSQNRTDFRCEAHLNLGPEGPPPMSSSPLDVTVHYKPIINATKLRTPIPVFSGYPEDLVCEAEGHPTPMIMWQHSPEKVVRVSGGTLTVTEAGLYTCWATNDVDSSSLEVEVILKVDYLPLIAGVVAIVVVAICVIFGFIYSIYYKNTKMRRYSLKNPKLSNQNGNVAHNGSEVHLPMTKLS